MARRLAGFIKNIVTTVPGMGFFLASTHGNKNNVHNDLPGRAQPRVEGVDGRVGRNGRVGRYSVSPCFYYCVK